MASKANEKHLKEQVEPSQAPAAVIPDESDDPINVWREIKSGLHLIPLELIVESPENARKTFNEDSIRDLGACIKEDGGVNQVPCKVHPIANDLLAQDSRAAFVFVLDDGARRNRALRSIGASVMKCEVVDALDSQDTLKRSLVCNLNREDLSPLEKSTAFGKMLKPEGKFGTVRELCKALGLSEHERSVMDLISLVSLTEAPRAALAEKRITLTHAVLIAREKPEDQARVLEACFQPQAIDNGGAMEMVATLISEKKLRDWIKENLREKPAPEAALPGMGETEDEKQQREAARLEAQGSAILDSAGDGEPDEDDLTEEQRAAVQPASVSDSAGKAVAEDSAATDIETTDTRRLLLKRACGLIRFPYPIAVYKLLAVRLLGTIKNSDAWNIREAIGYPGVSTVEEIRGIIMGYDERKVEDMQKAAKIVIALALAHELSPKVEQRCTEGLLHRLDTANAERDAHIKKSIRQLDARDKEKAKAKSKAPTPTQVSKVMKAEKAKLAAKKSKSKSKR